MGKGTLTHAELLERVSYDPETGIFTNRKTGRVLGTRHQSRSRANAPVYLRIRIGNTRVLAHVLAYFYMTGKWAPEQVDHRDNDGLNNRWENLRACTNAENQSNRPATICNTTGVKGVAWNRRDKCYYVTIQHQGRRFHLGCFKTIEEARAAYEAKAREVQGEFFYDDNKSKSNRRQRVGEQHSTNDNGACVSAGDPRGIYDTPTI